MTSTTTTDARIYLDQLNLSYIADRMCHESYPMPRWTKHDVAHCTQHYKNFLLLSKIHSNTPLVPTRQIDEFWHNHILYTKNYIHDCEQIFGYYHHHQPAVSGEDDEGLTRDYLRTKELYFAEFKQSLHLI